MCGISGFLDRSGRESGEALEAIVTRMAEALRHRGPDDGGTWVDAPAGIALGHRRLSILDLSPLGHQPMNSASGRWVIVFNGELYNFAELRDELVRSGAAFRGQSDTEVLVESIAAWGVAGALERFNGMFAFAAWDREERALVLARDRLGIKPIYYGELGGVVFFASELKAMHAHPAFHPELDHGALALYLRYG